MDDVLPDCGLQAVAAGGIYRPRHTERDAIRTVGLRPGLH